MLFFRKLFFAFTRREKIIFGVAAIAGIISLTGVSIVAFRNATTIVPTSGGTFTEGMVGQPEYVNPVTAQSETDLALVKMIYSNVDDIAASIATSSDGKTWTVRLKENLTWQDGQQLTSDDVIFTVQAIQDPDADSPLAGAWQDISVSRASELEVVFTLNAPDAFFGDQLKDLYIVPKHIFADVPPGNWRLSDDDLKPIGSGPYEFVSYDKEDNGFITDYDLTAWNGYANAEPLIQNFDFDFFANASDLIKSFNDADIDGFAASTDEISQIERPYDIFSWPTPTSYAIFWNQSTNQALQDNAVRAALNESVDRNSLVTDALHGEGVPTYSPIPPGAPYATAIDATTSAEDASTTLTNDGWLVGSNGFRSKVFQKGTVIPLAVTITVPDIDFLVQTADDIQNDWQSIGVAVTVATDSAQNIATDEIPNRDYEGLLFGNTLDPDSDLNAFWNSSERFSPGLNLAIYDNPQADALMAAIPETLDDASRTQMFAALQTVITNDNPAVFLYSPYDLYVTDKSVQGITSDFLPDPSDRLREVTQWYLNTARVLK